MKICIFYYSGAGNTECVAKIIGKVVQNHGHEVYCKRITKESLCEIKQNYDILGIGYPIHFRKAPSLVSEFITKQNGKGKNLFTFCTKGLYSGNASREIQLIAKQNLFTVSGNIELYMPGSDALALIAKKKSLTERLLKSIHSRKIRTKIEEFLSSIYQLPNLDGNRSKWYFPLDNGIVKPLEHYFTNNYQVFIERFSVIHELCDLCQFCVKNCPNMNIKLTDSNITFGSHCSFCLRCIHRCPHGAIQIKSKTEDKVKYHPTVTSELTIRYS